MNFLNKYLVIIPLILNSLTLSASDRKDEGHLLPYHLLGNEYSVKLLAPFESTMTYLKKKQTRYRHNKAFLRHLFYYVHRKHLKHYRQYSLLSEVMQSGTYDCVSGTALYALLLEGLGYSYQIWEMDYHVYLSLNVEGKTVVFEATDAKYGFMDQVEEIDEHRQYYEQKAQKQHNDSDKHEPLIYRPVTLKQLAGLQLYNRAIFAWNQQQKQQAKQYAEQALQYYPAQRIAYLARYVIK